MSSTQGVLVARHHREEEAVHLDLMVGDFAAHYNRPTSETISATLMRIKKVLTKKLAGKKNHMDKEGHPDSATQLKSLLNGDWGIALLNGEEHVAPDLSNEAAWALATRLVLGTVEVSVEFNPPTVEELHLGAAVVGYPFFPHVALRDVDEDACRWEWRRTASTTVDGVKDTDAVVCRQRTFTPSADDEGSYVSVKCTPVCKAGRVGLPTAAISKLPVRPLAPIVSLARRRVSLEDGDVDGPRLRVVTYNYLRDSYVLRNMERGYYTKEQLPHLETAPRTKAFAVELVAMDADVICVQELDRHVYREYLADDMAAAGYSGFFEDPELGLFYREETLAMVEEMHVENDCITGSENPDLRTIDRFPHLAKGLANNTRAQGAILTLRSDPSVGVAVLHAHLLGGPRVRHGRMIQTACYLEQLKRACDRHAALRLAPLFMGDLNSTADEGVHELLKDRFIPACHHEWAACRNYRPGRADAHDMDVISGNADKGAPSDDGYAAFELTHPFPSLKSAYEGHEPDYTYYSPRDDRSTGVVDFIYYDPGTAKVIDLLEPLPLDVVVGNGGMPSVGLPSDHAALSATFLLARGPAGD